MPRATYYLDFELSYNTWTNLAADWAIAEPLTIERGMEPGESIAQLGRMTFALYNPDGRYTPGHASARPGFDVGIGVRLRASDGVETRTLFYGRLAAIEAQRADERAPHVWITVEDEIAAAQRARLETFPLLVDATPGEVVGRLVDASFAPPGVFGYWRLGHAQASLLGTSSKLADHSTGKDLDTGQSVFPWVGDTWPSERSVYEALRNVAISEGGQFYLAADGTPVFADRHVRPKHVSADATLSGGLAGLRIERATTRLANQVEVVVYPRAIGAAAEVLWTSPAPIRVSPDQPRTLVCPYSDADQQVARIGAQSVIVPEPGVDFTATDRLDGAGIDLTGFVTVAVEPGGSAARLVIRTAWHSPDLSPTYVHNLRLRGTPMRAFQPVSAVRLDEASRFAHGSQPLILDLPLQADAAVGYDRAVAVLAARKDPRPWLVVQGEATVSAAMLAQALPREIGDRLALTDASLALSAEPCFIDAIRHEIVRGGARHRFTWHTSPAGMLACWVLGQAGAAELGTASRLGY